MFYLHQGSPVDGTKLITMYLVYIISPVLTYPLGGRKMPCTLTMVYLFFSEFLSHISVWLSCASTECLNDAGGGADL